MYEQELCAAAINAMKNSYSPYSGVCVGAALLTASGKIYSGCNIENASYSASVCAERTALFKAVSCGEKNFSALAVAGGKAGVISGLFPPCGICRQVLCEFCAADFTVLMVTGINTYRKITLGELLPAAFSADFL